MAEVKKDCFAYDESTKRCKILRSVFCKWQQCRFYKKKGTLCNGCLSKGNALACSHCQEARKV